MIYFSNNPLPTRNKTKQYQDYMGFRCVFIQGWEFSADSRNFLVSRVVFEIDVNQREIWGGQCAVRKALIIRTPIRYWFPTLRSINRRFL